VLINETEGEGKGYVGRFPQCVFCTVCEEEGGIMWNGWNGKEMGRVKGWL